MGTVGGAKVTQKVKAGKTDFWEEGRGRGRGGGGLAVVATVVAQTHLPSECMYEPSILNSISK